MVVQAAARNKEAVKLAVVTTEMETDPRAMLLLEMVNWKQ
jgi:hypothetical protein